MFFLIQFLSILIGTCSGIRVVAKNKGGEYSFTGKNVTFTYTVTYEPSEQTIPSSLQITVKCSNDTQYTQMLSANFENNVLKQRTYNLNEYKNRSNIVYSNNIVFFTLAYVKEKDFNCEYECIVIIDDFTKNSDLVLLLKAEKPVIAQSTLFQGKPQYVVKGTNREFPCTAGGVPSPIVTWYRSSGNSVNVIERAGEALLLITGADMFDTDTYYCMAENVAGKTEVMSTTIFVVDIKYDGPPYSKVRQPVGTWVTMNCPITGFDFPADRLDSSSTKLAYTWYDPTGASIATVKSHSLNIRSSREYGNYTCEAQNPAGKLTHILELEEIADRASIASTIDPNASTSNASARCTPLLYCLLSLLTTLYYLHGSK